MRFAETAPVAVILDCHVNVNLLPLIEISILSNFFLSAVDIKPAVEVVAASWLCVLGENVEGLPVMLFQACVWSLAAAPREANVCVWPLAAAPMSDAVSLYQAAVPVVDHFK